MSKGGSEGFWAPILCVNRCAPVCLHLCDAADCPVRSGPRVWARPRSKCVPVGGDFICLGSGGAAAAGRSCRPGRLGPAATTRALQSSDQPCFHSMC